MIILAKHDRNKVLYILFARLVSNMAKKWKIQRAVNHLVMIIVYNVHAATLFTRVSELFTGKRVVLDNDIQQVSLKWGHSSKIIFTICTFLII